MASSRCVFCGQPITETDATVGRPPHAAHAACADAALADDAHWDAVAAASGVEEQERPEPESGREPSSPSRGIGCVTIALAVSIVLAVRLIVDARNWALTRR